MASGHVNRTQRPNTWLHRPRLRREDSPCQLGAVHTWPIATLKCSTSGCRLLGEERKSSNSVGQSLGSPGVRKKRRGLPACSAQTLNDATLALQASGSCVTRRQSGL